jgi:hypothetical protein
MGRRDDVLHGQFVEFEDEDAPALATATPVLEVLPVPTRPRPTQSAPKPPAPKPVVATPGANEAALQSLLASIKQELKNAAKI